MAADYLAQNITRSSAAIVLMIQNEKVHVLYEEEFQLPTQSLCYEIIENANRILV